MFNSSVTKWFVCTLLLILIGWTSLFLYYPMEIGAIEALTSLLPSDDISIASITVFNLRLPRIIACVLIGSGLSVAGLLLQSITRNPLASPTLLGINSGASLTIVVAMAFNPAFLASYSLSVISGVGGGLSWLLVALISAQWRNGVDKSRLILSGVAVSFLCAALTKMTMMLAEDATFDIMSWLAGGYAHIRWASVTILADFIIPSLLLSFLLAKQLNIVGLGDESAQSLGISLFTLRLLCNLCALAIVGACVSIAGPFSFIGLLVPHLSKFLVGYDCRQTIPMSIILGASLMLLADTLARALAFPNELAAGAVLALIGAPFFVILARGRSQ